MLKGYTKWYFHGEGSSSAAGEGDRPHHDDSSRQDGDDDVGSGVAVGKGPDANAQNFFRLLQDAKHDLYPDSKLSKLNFVVRLFHIKYLNGWSNKSFTMLLELLKEALPVGESLPNSFYETKKIIRDLGLHYNKIDACPNDCMLYWKEAANDSACRICGASRWKSAAQNSNGDRSSSSTGVHKVSAKILRHFPLKPRLQRLYMSKKTTSFMTWHDPRNVRLGLASDGFNPFRTMSIAHSMWLVILMPYNLPPWMCMKQPYMMLSLLIPGPSAPGNDIDVYLQPLIEELKELWEDGLQTYDPSRNETFRMPVAVLWTINDFPAYANLSGWSTKGKLACPSFNKDTCSRRLKHGEKECYMGHRRFLATNHKFIFEKWCFDGTVEDRLALIPLTGCEELDQLKCINITFGKKRDKSVKKPDTRGQKRPREENPMRCEENSLNCSNSAAKNKPTKEHNWKKKTIFSSLPYWESLLFRHSLDAMHIEKNVCDNVIRTLLNIEEKTKDSLKARLDLQQMGIRRAFHPMTNGKNKTYLPPACFTMSTKEKVALCNILKDIKVPDGFSSNI
ncbi:uncharacterized protein LOC143887729 [Tasmannia lanceolata]|uniref:uncharacterized protein LOC143887729 n=1 Tax=Tasmannia lanceolata TaxID=3420 RepID=UPI004063034F